MERNYDAIMSRLSDENLIKISILRKQNYQSEAVLAAEHVLRSRNHSTEYLDKLSQKVREKEYENEEFEDSKVKAGIRLAIFTIDNLIFFIPAMILHMKIDLSNITLDLRGVRLIGFGTFFTLFFLYFIVMEYHFQKTLGKYITRTKVVSYENQKPNFKQIVIRTLGRVLPFDRFSFMIMTNGFHDRLSKTAVVKDNEQ